MYTLFLFLLLPRTYKFEKCADVFVKRFLGDQAIFLVNPSETTINLENPKILFNTEDPFVNFDNFTQKDVHYVIEASNSAELNDVLAHFFKHKQWNSKAKHLILLSELDVESVAESFKALWFYDVYNVVIISPLDSTGYTWHPFEGRSKCGTLVHVEQFNSCSHFDPYVKKIIRTSGCWIKTTWHPQMFLLESPGATTKPSVSINLLKWIKKRLKATIKKSKLTNAPLNKTPQSHYVSELIEKVESEKIDIIINDLLNYNYPIHDNRLEKSAALFLNELVWVLPQKQRIPAWIIFFEILPPLQCFQMFCAYLSLLALWSCTRNANFLDSCFVITKLFLCQGVSNSNGVTKKVIVASIAFLIIHFSCLFTSRMTSLLANPFYGSITTLKQLADIDAQFTYNDYTSYVLKETDYNIWKQIEAKRTAEKDSMELSKLIDFLGRNLNDSNRVFEINSLMLHYHLKNIEEVEIHPKKVSGRFFTFSYT